MKRCVKPLRSSNHVYIELSEHQTDSGESGAGSEKPARDVKRNSKSKYSAYSIVNVYIINIKILIKMQ